MAALLWDGASDADAVMAFTRLAESGALEVALQGSNHIPNPVPNPNPNPNPNPSPNPTPNQRAEAEGQAAAARETEELTNLPGYSGKVERNQHRKREPVKRTD